MGSVGIVAGLVSRNLRLFFRDPLNVFFSLLGALIVFLLYTLFLSNVQTASITQSSPEADVELVRGFVDSWMFAGIVALSTMTTPLGALSSFVDDAATGRFRDFLVSPIRRSQLVLGYLLSAVAIGVLLTLAVLVVALVYLWALSGVALGVPEVLRSILWVVLSTLGFASLWAFIISFIRTNGAFAALSTIVGTVVGFVAGAYIAVGLFPEAVRSTISALPFAQSAMLLRQEFTAGPLDELVGGHGPAIAELQEFFGVRLSVGGWDVPDWFPIAMLVGMTVLFSALAAGRIRSRLR